MNSEALFTFNPFRVVDQEVMQLLFTLNPFGIQKTIFTKGYIAWLEEMRNIGYKLLIRASDYEVNKYKNGTT